MDEDKAEDIYLYFKEDAESDSLDDAVEELGGDYTEEEIRLVRIKFMCEQGTDPRRSRGELRRIPDGRAAGR